MKKKQLLHGMIATSAASLLVACGGGGDAVDTSPKSITLEFAAYSGTTPVSCGTTQVTGLGSGSVSALIKDFRFYVSGVKLRKADGSTAELTLTASDDWNIKSTTDSITLIDLEDGTGSCSAGTAATNAVIKGTVPAGDYTGVELTIGVPYSLNHSDYATATKPMDIQAMAWSWTTGRKFAKIELTDPAGTAGTWTAKTFNFHLGSTGCTGNPATGATATCTTPNRMAVRLDSFNPSTQKIAVDVQALVAGTDITKNVAGAVGCMSGATDPECLKVFEAIGIDWKADGTGTGLPINNGLSQTVLKAVSK